MNLIKDLWKGDIPLVTTFWIYNFLANIILAIPGIIIETTWTQETINQYSATIYLYFLITILYSLLILVALWRSADKYINDIQNKGKYWGGITKILVILGALRSIVEFSQLF